MIHRFDPVDRRPFGRTGLLVAPLGFGGAPIGLLASDRDAVASILNGLLDRGANLIDTAAMYYGSEEAIRDAVGHRRDEFVLVSKCGHAEEGMPGKSWSPELITAQIDRSLRRLGTDRIDVMLLHSCDEATLVEGPALDAVVRARDAGKVRFAGYSGDGSAGARATTMPDVAVIQTSLSIVDQRNLAEVIAPARAAGIGVMVKRPIANACWKGAEQYDRYRNYAEPYVERFAAMGLDPEALGLDPARLASEWPRLALRYTAHAPGVDVAIVGTTRADRIEANIAAIQAGPLPDDIVAAIGQAFRAAEPAGGWPGLT